MTITKSEKPVLDDEKPAKGGIERADPDPHPGDSPKKHGDPFKDDRKQDK